MECPYCGAELIWDDTYGTGRPEYYSGTAACGLHYPSTWHKLGDIYKCPNCDGFDNEDEAITYAKENNIRYDNWEDIVCESNCFNGDFYTDEQENLHEGYPC